MKLIHLIIFRVALAQAGFFFSWFSKNPLAELDAEQIKLVKQTFMEKKLLHDKEIKENEIDQ